MREYSLEHAIRSAKNIMVTTMADDAWPESDVYRIGSSWILHMFIKDGAKQAVLYELDEYGNNINKSAMNLTVPEKGDEEYQRRYLMSDQGIG